MAIPSSTVAAHLDQHRVEQGNFNHLVMDIFWFGLALPATSRFVSVFALRVGASVTQVAWLTAFPALVLLLAAGLGQWWYQRHPNSVRAVFWPGLGFRLSFLLPAFTPLLPTAWQPWWLVASIALPSLPQGIASVVFLVMMREVVSTERLTRLISRRYLAMNLAVGVSTFGLGFWLSQVPYPVNYQTMYIAAFFITLVSLWHVNQAAPLYRAPAMPHRPRQWLQPWRDRSFRDVIRLILLSHIAFFFVFPFIPVYLIEWLGAGEQFMGLFVLVELLAGAAISFSLPYLASRYGARPLIGVAMAGTALSTLAILAAPNLPLTLIGAALNGASWTMGGVAMYGYFNERLNPAHAASYTTCYNQIIFLAMFVGPLVSGGLMAGHLSIETALLAGVGLRVVVALLPFVPQGRLYAPVRWALPARR